MKEEMSAIDTGDAIKRVLELAFGRDSEEFRSQIDDLLRVFDKRTEEDDFKEILQVTHPKAHHLNGWHLERLAMEEYEQQTPLDVQRKIQHVKKDMKTSRALISAMLAREKEWTAKRDAFIKTKQEQREAMKIELEEAKSLVQKLHVVHPSTDPIAAQLAEPAPIEERLLAHVQASSSDIDLSQAPSV